MSPKKDWSSIWSGLVLMCRSCGLDTRKPPEGFDKKFKDIRLRDKGEVYAPICPICGQDCGLYTKDQAEVDDLIRSTRPQQGES
jgi:hypothetical protein